MLNLKSNRMDTYSENFLLSFNVNNRQNML